MTTSEFAVFEEQYAKEPVLFFFETNAIDREDLNHGITRRECIKKSHTAIPLSEFDTEWNDTDAGLNADNEPSIYIPDPQKSWCYVSMPEKINKKSST